MKFVNPIRNRLNTITNDVLYIDLTIQTANTLNIKLWKQIMSDLDNKLYTQLIPSATLIESLTNIY